MIIISIALLICVFAVFLLIFSIWPKMVLLPNRRKSEYYQEKFGFSHPSQLSLLYKECSLKTDDRLLLSYWLIDGQKCKESDATVIYLHGITDSKASGLNYARELVGNCLRIFLIDMRRHGDSEGNYCTFGFYEKKDVVKLIDKIKQDSPESNIILLGVSMGAAIAIQTAAIDKRVNKVIAVAPFYDLFSIALDHQVRKIGIKSKILLKLVLKRAEQIANFRTSDVSPAQDIAKIDVPILIVHGENDKSVKREYPQKLVDLNKKAQLFVVHGAGHVDVLERGGRAYMEKLIEFIKNGN